MKNDFTDEEKKYIIDNWNKESISSMRKKLKCGWKTVAKFATSNGLELPKSNKWTDDEVSMLIELSKKYSAEQIAMKLNKSKNSVYLKARKMDIIFYGQRRKWTKEEELEFEELWGTMELEKLAKKLGRSVYSLKVKAVRMGLGSMIGNNTDILTIYDVVDILNISRDKVITWSKCGLKLKEKFVTKSKSYYYVEWNDLIDFLKTHQDLWDSNKVDMYMLGEETDWLKEKRKRDSLNKPREYRVWTNSDKITAINYFKSGYSYEDIAKLLKRSEWAIKFFLNNSGYHISDRKKWTKEELEYLKEHFMNMKYSDIAKELNKTTASVEYNLYKNGYTKRLTNKKVLKP